MHSQASPLHTHSRRHTAVQRTARTLAVALFTVLLLGSVLRDTASARVDPRRDRRSDREITVPYRSPQVRVRRDSGYVMRDQQPSSSAQTSSSDGDSANSGETRQDPSNKNDGRPRLRDTGLRRTR